MCSVLLMGIELKIITKTNHLYRLILGFTVSLASDIFYLVKGFSEWKYTFPFDFPLIGKSTRLIAVSICVGEVLLKVRSIGNI